MGKRVFILIYQEYGEIFPDKIYTYESYAQALKRLKIEIDNAKYNGKYVYTDMSYQQESVVITDEDGNKVAISLWVDFV